MNEMTKKCKINSRLQNCLLKVPETLKLGWRYAMSSYYIQMLQEVSSEEL